MYLMSGISSTDGTADYKVWYSIYRYNSRVYDTAVIIVDTSNVELEQVLIET